MNFKKIAPQINVFSFKKWVYNIQYYNVARTVYEYPADFRDFQYSMFNFVTENADAKCSYRHRPHLLQTVLMETNAFWTNIAEKVVNVKSLVGKHMGNCLRK